jgi:GNAT superfamily N-acetyltransferase
MRIRRAAPDDEPAIARLMDRAIRELQKTFLSEAEIEASADIMGLDGQLIADGTYFVVEEAGALIGCGGWSRRATLYGGAHTAGRDASVLDPATDPARVRAMYTDPDHARRGVGRLILNACETAARAEGFKEAALVATLSGHPLYLACGYEVVEETMAPTRSGLDIPVRHMRKSLV